MPGDTSTTDRAVVDSAEDTLVTPVSGVAAAVATLVASAVTGEDPARLTVHPGAVAIPLADRVRLDSEDNRRIDIRSSARVAAKVDTKTVVPEDTGDKEDREDREDTDTVDATVEG